MKLFIKVNLIFINLLFFIGIGLSYISSYVNPSINWIPSIMAIGSHFLIIGNLFFIIFWGLKKNWLVIFSLSILLIGSFISLPKHIQLHKITTQKKGIILCSYNVRSFTGHNGKAVKEWDRMLVKKYLKEIQADIICFQEINHNLITGFNPFHNDSTAYYTSDKNELITISRYPIIREGKYFFEKSNMIIFSDLKIDNDTIRIFNCHLQSYNLPSSYIQSINTLSLNKQLKNINITSDYLSKFKYYLIKRANQSDLLREKINECPYPVIVCGDLNDTPDSYTYHTIKGEMKDAYIESGYGTGSSYIRPFFSLRIDYIFHDNFYKSYDFSVDNKKYSDHKPIWCKLIKNDLE